MRRRTRLLALLAVPVLLLGLTAGVAGASVIEDYARVIRSRHAGATFVQVDGCRQVEVFLSAMDAKFGTRGGRVNKQGLVGVFYAERDICVEPGPKGYPITYSADGMSLDRLGSSPRFGAAWVRASIPGLDSDGNAVSIGLERPLVTAGSCSSGHGYRATRGSRPAANGARMSTPFHMDCEPTPWHRAR